MTELLTNFPSVEIVFKNKSIDIHGKADEVVQAGDVIRFFINTLESQLEKAPIKYGAAASRTSKGRLPNENDTTSKRCNYKCPYCNKVSSSKYFKKHVVHHCKAGKLKQPDINERIKTSSKVKPVGFEQEKQEVITTLITSPKKEEGGARRVE